MGPRMAPPYADLFMGRFEQQTFYNSLLKRSIWCMFIDDIFMIWTHGEEHLKSFIGFLNSIYRGIKFTHEYSNSLHQTLPRRGSTQFRKMGPKNDSQRKIVLLVVKHFENTRKKEGAAPPLYPPMLPFLDVQVHLINNHIETDLHTKPIGRQTSIRPQNIVPPKTHQKSHPIQPLPPNPSHMSYRNFL